MPLFRTDLRSVPGQLELQFVQSPARVFPERAQTERSHDVVGQALRLPNLVTASDALALQLPRHRDRELEERAAVLLRTNGAARIARDIIVEWNSRLRSCAGRADYRTKTISLNPLLREHSNEEVDRTFLHELAHLLAQFGSGRRRIAPHGEEWREACRNLGIGDEKRCHNLPLPVRQHARRFVYRCPNCRRDFPRVRRIRRAVACLACCRAHNHGEFDPRFKLRRVP